MLHILRLAIPNVYLLTGERGAVLIDAGGPADASAILAFLQAHGVPRPTLILLTHGHWDHAGAAKELRELTGAPIALHRADLPRVQSGKVWPERIDSVSAWLVYHLVNRPFPPFEPDIILDDEIDLMRFGVEARVLFTPGHTAGSISVLTGDGEMIVGDLLFGGYLGGKLFPSRPGLHYFVEDRPQLRASIAKVLALSPRAIWTGHGGPLDPEAVARRFGSA